jgi:P-type E1-E2 ATPase
MKSFSSSILNNSATTTQVVLTITLAGGSKAMVKRNVIVRRLNSLEALGAVTDICSDKTGTLTQGTCQLVPFVHRLILSGGCR